MDETWHEYHAAIGSPGADEDDGPPPEFYEECAKHCRCCPLCWSVPCDGCCAGGICDDFDCKCESSGLWDDDDFAYGDDPEDSEDY